MRERLRAAGRFIGVVATPLILLIVATQVVIPLFVDALLPTTTPPSPETLPVSEWPRPRVLQPSSTLPVGEDELQGVFDIAASGRWLLAVGRRRVVGVDTVDRSVHDLTAISTSFPIVGFSGVWGGDENEFFLSEGNADVFSRLVLASDGERLSLETDQLFRDERSIRSLPVSGGLWLSNGLFPDVLLNVSELVDDRLVTRSRRGQPIFRDVPHDYVLRILQQNAIAASPDGTRIVQVFMQICRVHVYSASGTLERLIAGPIEIRLEYTERIDELDGETKYAGHLEGKFCYVDVAATSNGIIALFSGRKSGNFGREMSDGDQLHVFDWDGRFLDVWKLDSAVQNIAASPDGAVLWAFERGTPRLVEYTLPVDWKRAAARY